MKVLEISAVLIIFVLIGSELQGADPQPTDSAQDERYVSIEGLWRCTPGTSLKFVNGVTEPVIRIDRDSNGQFTVEGYYLWNGCFYDEWPMDSTQYNDSLGTLTLTAGNGVRFTGTVDEKKQRISGMAHNDEADAGPDQQLNFVRADDTLKTRLLCPLEPGVDGSILYNYRQPEQTGDGLETASAFEFVSDSAAFYDFLAECIGQEFGRLESLLILKDNKLVLEEYYYGYDRTQLHNIHSCAKSVTSLLLGIALERHPEVNLDQSIFDFFPEYDSLKKAGREDITLRHVLTMNAGLELTGIPYEMLISDDWLEYILNSPMAREPGTGFDYSDCCAILLGGVVHFLEGQHASVYAAENLFAPLGITEYRWETRRNGLTNCSNNLFLRPRDMAKIGLLVLNDGKWGDEQIVDKEWIRESTRPKVAESDYFDYGYQWWHRSRKNRPWWREPQEPIEHEYNMALAQGIKGQYIMVVRDLNMVIVTTASDYTKDFSRTLLKIPMVVEKIVPLFNGPVERTVLPNQ